MKPRNSRAVILLTLGLAATGPHAGGEVLAYEGFGGAADGQSLNGYTPGLASTGLSGPWVMTVGGAQRLRSSATPLHLAIAAGHRPESTGGASHWWEHNNNWNTNKASVPLTVPVNLAADGTWFMSFFSTSRIDDFTAQIGLSDGTNELLWGQGYNRGLTAYHAPVATTGNNNDANQNNTDITVANRTPNDTLFFVAKLVKTGSGGTNTLTVSIKAYNLTNSSAVDAAEPATWQRTVALTGVSGSFHSLAARLDGAGTNVPSMDEIRLGQSWTDVTGIGNAPSLPVFAVQPVAVTNVAPGGNATFTAEVVGNPAPVLMWERSTDGGATWNPTGDAAASLVVTEATLAMDGFRYRLQASNSQGEVLSAESVLHVAYPLPVITAQPVSVINAVAGAPANLTVAATGLGTPTYQWQRSEDAGNTWTDLAGRISSTLAFAAAGHADAGLYRCLVTDHAAEAASLPATVTVSNWACLAFANSSSHFVWSPANSAMVYDGAGPDSGIDPYTQVGNDIGIGLGAGNASRLEVAGGTLSVLNIDQWAPKIGHNGGAAGVVTVKAGATFNFGDTGLGSANNIEQRISIGNSATGTLNVEGGTVNVHVGPAGTGAGGSANSNDAARAFRIGSGNATGNGTVNLIDGVLHYPSNAPLNIGADAATGTVKLVNGRLRVTGTSNLVIGTDAGDCINFTSGGSGSVAVLGWDSVTDPDYLRFKELIDLGRIRIDGAAVPGLHDRFVFSDENGLGVLKLDGSLLAPLIVSEPASYVEGPVGGSVTLAAVASGNPAPSLLWEVSTDFMETWMSTGATTASITFDKLAFNGGNPVFYRMKATNSLGEIHSLAAEVHAVFRNPGISAQPVSLAGIHAGGQAAFSVTATGIGPITYQWQRSADAGNTWADVPSATSATLTLDPVTHADAGLYRVVVTDGGTSAGGGEALATASNWASLSLANTSSGFVWSPANSAMVYDGAGADAAIEPYTQTGSDIGIGLGDGNFSTLTVASGHLSILNVDQWSPKIGKNDVIGNTGSGIVTVNAGATLNLGDTGAGGSGGNIEQRVTLGARANGTLNVDGGTVNVDVGPAGNGAAGSANASDAIRGFRIGGANSALYTGTLNLHAGTLDYRSDAPLQIGLDAGHGVVNLGNGQLRVTGTSEIRIGGGDGDCINFVQGGSGSLAVRGWDSQSDPDRIQFKALVDAGRIRINGVAVGAGNYAPFLFSDEEAGGGVLLGVVKVDPDHVFPAYAAWAAANAGGQGAALDADHDGVPNGIEYFMNSAAGLTIAPAIVGGSVSWPNGGNIAAAGYGTRFVVQTSPDLVVWTPVPAADPALANTGGSVRYTLPAGSGRTFVRLVVMPE